MMGKLTMTLHDSEELYNDLRRRPDKDLALSTALSIDNIVLTINSTNQPSCHIKMLPAYKAVILTTLQSGSLYYLSNKRNTHKNRYADHSELQDVEEGLVVLSNATLVIMLVRVSCHGKRESRRANRWTGSPC